MERVARERIFAVSYYVVVSKMVYLFKVPMYFSRSIWVMPNIREMLMVDALDRGADMFSHSQTQLFGGCVGLGAFEWKGKE